MGIHLGQPRKVVDPVTRRAEFVGPPVNTAARITTLAQGGQVVLSAAVWENIKGTALAKERNRCAYLGKCEMPDSPQGRRPLQAARMGASL
jgi:class 3 adenylate cyclase